jgi:hypothetical protein
MRAWKAALLIAGIAVAIDFLFHFVFLPEMVGVPGAGTGGQTMVQIAFHESPAYFIAKIAVFALIAYAFLKVSLMAKGVGPILYGLAASTIFGLVYYVYPAISVGTGSMSVALKVAWGGIHAGAGMLAAGLYARKASAVIVGIALLVLSGLALVLFGAQLAGVAIPGY